MFRDHHFHLLAASRTIIIDSGGGEELAAYSADYFQVDEPMHIARKRGIDLAETKFTLNLDADTLLPAEYPKAAVALLEKDPKLAAVALDYESPGCQGHLAFGTSIARTDLLKQLYDWRPGKGAPCECFYMWVQFRQREYLIETLPMRARHLKVTRNKNG